MEWVVNASSRPIYPPVITRYPLYRRLNGRQGWSGRVRDISHPPGFDPRTVQLAASGYTSYAIPAYELYNTVSEEWNKRNICHHNLAILSAVLQHRRRQGWTEVCLCVVTANCKETFEGGRERTCWGKVSGGITPLILNLGTGWRGAGSFVPSSL
jgi:hypothetical protein